MLAAAFCLAFHGLLRVSEYTSPSARLFRPRLHATVGDLQWSHSSYTFHLKRSKTDQCGHGTTITLYKCSGLTCPYRSMAQYLAHTDTKAPHTTPLFHFADGHPLTRRTLLKHLRRLLQRAGFQAHNFNTHSFRIGGATSAAALGIPYHSIQQRGRWSSDAYKHYIRQLTRAPGHTGIQPAP